ncbi:MAG: folate-binding protein YgfZ [Microbacteriaceae bacterium]|nr:folate-binding protein YgfZ [Microbacteriaceae bacterium]
MNGSVQLEVNSQFLDLPGAVEATGPDAGVAAHYGNPLAEQRSLKAGKSVVDLTNNPVIEVSGVDRLSWLESMTSQKLTTLKPGQSAEALLLGPTGRIDHVLKLIEDGSSIWILLENSELEPVLSWLNSMRFMLRVEVVDRTDSFATIGWFEVAGVDPGLQVASPHGVELTWRDPWNEVQTGGYQYAEAEAEHYRQWTWRESLVERSLLSHLDHREFSGTLAAEALRIAAWRPRFATEVDEKSIPHELDWLRSAVHLTKGCYRGQETVAKVHNLGHPPRRLVLLQLDGSENLMPTLGAEVMLDDKVVGSVTSVANHFELGPIALAVVKRNTDPEAPLRVSVEGSSIPATQEVIVPVDAGATAPAPRLPRLGAR